MKSEAKYNNVKAVILFAGKEYEIIELEDRYSIESLDLNIYKSEVSCPLDILINEFAAVIRKGFMESMIDPDCQISVSADDASRFYIENRIELGPNQTNKDALYETFVGILDGKYEVFINPYKD